MITSNTKIISKRIAARLNSLQPSDPKAIRALTRIGALIQARAILNIRRKRIIDTGALVNSIIFEVSKNNKGGQVVVGSERIPYAKIHEFGHKTFSARMRRAMFHSIKSSGRRNPNRDKDVIRGSVFRARPFLGPALFESKGDIMRILRELVK
ncbi:MAG: HK97 gp10 family phage protein [Candidatus Paceibacterota bacterium]